MAHFGKMNFGHIIRKMKTEIESCLFGKNNLLAVYGFGSFFRGSNLYSDIDILVVCQDNSDDSLELYYYVLRNLRFKEVVIDVPIDITFLSLSEFKSQPLRDMAELVPLWRIKD